MGTTGGQRRREGAEPRCGFYTCTCNLYCHSGETCTWDLYCHLAYTCTWDLYCAVCHSLHSLHLNLELVLALASCSALQCVAAFILTFLTTLFLFYNIALHTSVDEQLKIYYTSKITGFSRRVFYAKRTYDERHIIAMHC